MTATDFHNAEARTGAGAGGITPRRLIPSRFRRPAPTSEPEDWTASPVRVAVVLAVSAAASLAMTLSFDRSADRSAVIAPAHLPAPPHLYGDAGVTPGAGVGADAHDVRSSVPGSELFE